LELKEAECMWRKAFDQGARRSEFGFVNCADNQALVMKISPDSAEESFEWNKSKRFEVF